MVQLLQWLGMTMFACCSCPALRIVLVCWLWVPLCAFVAVASALVGVATPVISGTGTVTPPLLPSAC
jgi:hypothetical protein